MRNRNKEQDRKWGKEYYKKNKEKANRVSREYYQKNKEWLNESSREYYKENKEKLNKLSRENHLNNKERDSEIRLKYRYGITTEDHKKLYESQNGICPICKNKFKFISENKTEMLFIDHNHKTGIIRGLICRRCNLLLGHANDDVKLLLNAVEYLKKSK
jgi:hypothetical protein